MQDYTKFKLKSENKLSALISDKDNFFVLSCNKCFKLFDDTSSSEPEPADFTDFLIKNKKTVIKTLSLDFLCNTHKLSEILSFMSLLDSSYNCSKPPCVVVISCGIGVQAVAALLDIPVYTACDTVKDAGNHGISLAVESCSACGQCFLNITDGICPVTRCPKGQLNGQCGGSEDGKCETDEKSDCIWSLISATEASSGFSSSDCINLFNHSNINRLETLEAADFVKKRREESFYGGLYLKHRKGFSAFLTLENFPIPKKVTIPMSQHAGMSADPIVKVGDYVKTGQKIGEAVGTLSSSVHASICGVVSEITSYRHPNSYHNSLCISIETPNNQNPDEEDLHPSVIPIPYWEDLDILDIDAIIAEKGIVGMGGAGFPTPVKLKAPKPIDTILLNGCESEPYITADHRIMLQYADDIIKGLQIMLKCTNAKRGIIVISDNKSDCIHHLEAKTADIDDIFVMALWSKYPQGAERMLIARTLGRKLSHGQRPYDVGAIVINVSTARAIGDAFTRGMPLIERAVTVSGEKVRNPCNLMVRIGTPVADIMNYCAIARDSNVILGGPMMGKRLDSYDIPVIKGTNAVIATARRFTQSADCIRCGRCVDVCPLELLPLYYPIHKKHRNWDAMRTGNVAYCVECACCSYVCPSQIDIVDAVRQGKLKL